MVYVHFPAVAPPDATEASGEDKITKPAAAVVTAEENNFLRLEMLLFASFMEYKAVDRWAELESGVENALLLAAILSTSVATFMFLFNVAHWRSYVWLAVLSFVLPN